MRKYGGMPLTGNTRTDQNLHEVARTESILKMLGGTKKRIKPKKKTHKKQVRKIHVGIHANKRHQSRRHNNK